MIVTTSQRHKLTDMAHNFKFTQFNLVTHFLQSAGDHDNIKSILIPMSNYQTW